MNTLFVEYDDLLINRIDEFDFSNFYGNEASEINERIALSVVKYAIEDILKWDKTTALKKFDEYIIKAMKLDRIVKYIDYPPEIPVGNAKYILSLIYPSDVKINQQLLCAETFANVINSNGKQFPRDYFAGGVGFQRFCYCIKYLIENYKPFAGIPEMYEFFLSPAGKKFLSLYRLQTPIYQFKLDMCLALKYITKNHPDCELYYTYYKFMEEYNNLKAAN